MPLPSTVVLKALGLNLSPNQLNVPDGSLVEAKNVVIRRDNVVESRRGFHIYGDAMGISTDRAKAFAIYKDRILRHYATTLEFDDGEGDFTAFTGSLTEAEVGIRTKFLEANGNLYMTSSEGIKKISVKTASDLSATTPITSAGTPKALDLKAYLQVISGDQDSLLPQDSVVAYRMLWGSKDAAGNLLLGSPSARVVVTNPMLPLIVADIERLLATLDVVGTAATGTLSDTNYLATIGEAAPALGYTSAASDVRLKLMALAVKIDADIFAALPAPVTSIAWSGGIATITFPAPHGLVVGDKINVTASNPSGYNGKFILTAVPSTTTASYALVSDPGTYIGDAVVTHIKYSYLDDPIETSEPTTHLQLQSMQDYLDAIIEMLQAESITVIAANEQTLYVTPLAITTTAHVWLEITVPAGITSDHFFQIYRTAITTAQGEEALSDLSPGDEMRLVYEAFPASTTAGAVETIEDIVTDEFRQFNTNLYTNEQTGDGILQANDPPPFAHDINRFKNVTFYANTRTRHKLFPLQLLGVQNVIDDYDPANPPQLTITDGVDTLTLIFRLGDQEVTDVTCVIAGLADGEYFTLNGANDDNQYYVWYDVTGAAVDPAVAGRTGIRVRVEAGDTNAEVALKTQAMLLGYESDFHTTRVTNVLTITNTFAGYCTDATSGTSPFTVTVTDQGEGENAATKEVLLSNSDSPAQAIDETARSLTRVVNRQGTGSPVYFYYISDDTQAPGKMNVESRTIADQPFYIVANSDELGASFSPDSSPTNFITVISMANPTVVTSVAHGLSTGDVIVITGSNSTPTIDGLRTVTVTGPNTFTVPVNVTVAGTQGAFILAEDATVSDNEVKGNRVYYSKPDQPEAVPLTNYIDIAGQDDVISRIFPLRDSLFTFKSDGLFRISGESAPFTLALFDGTTFLIADDSVAALDNILYCWTDQGIQTVSESGVDLVSRPIDTEILMRGSAEYPNFRTATWGIGYDSDNSYTVYTVDDRSDTVAHIGFRYSSLTSSWTTIDKSFNCGIIASNDKMYVGPTDTNFIEQERKNFERTDYADRELSSTISSGALSGTILQLSSVTGFAVGDVLTQDQVLTVYTFNQLLQKLDLDTSPSLSDDYYSTLAISAGVNLRNPVVTLAAKLDTDLGGTTYSDAVASLSGSASAAAGAQTVFTDAAHGLVVGRFITITGHTEAAVNGIHEVVAVTLNTFTIDVTSTVADASTTYSTNDNSFDDIGGCFNAIVTLLNLDANVDFSNYDEIEFETLQEVVILAVDVNTKKLTLSLALDFVQGPITIYKAIDNVVTYSRITFGDPLSLKHLSEATVMLESRAFSLATVGFSTDLYPQVEEIDFRGDGPGIFGFDDFGLTHFGGASNSPPLRTIVPRVHQRCRYLGLQFSHMVAREQYQLLGITVTGMVGPSKRAYR